MKRNGIRKNNKGDSLILVIGAIAMLSLLGIVILAKTLDNQAMKHTEEKAQEAFFEADSSTAEMATALETVAQEAIEKAFSDMLMEYSSRTNESERKQRFSDVFTTSVMRKFKTNYPTSMTMDANALEGLLLTALGGTGLTDLTVTYDDAVVEPPEDGTVDTETAIVRIKNATFAYAANGTRTSITTDICIQAQIPDISTGFQSGMTCDFSDFTIITDGKTEIPNGGGLNLNGNLYVGDDLLAGGGTSGTLTVNQADKMLVREDLVIANDAVVNITQTGTALSSGQGVWAKGIAVNGGTLNTSQVNVYVADDLSVDGTGATVVLAGTGNEYIGYSGNTASTAKTHEKSSAITVNTVKGTTLLDFDGLGKLYVNGYSYIYDAAKWDAATEGVLQGESIAYKDMQAMYLVPGKCLAQGHNPIIGATSTTMDSDTYTIEKDGSTVSMNLGDYIDGTTKFVSRIGKLEDGASALYAYLNLRPDKAAQFVQDYLNSPIGDMIKNQIKNLGAGSRIELPPDTITLANAISYNGSNLTMHPAADAAQKQVLQVSSQIAKQRYGGLFKSLTLLSALPPAEDYKLLTDGILTADAFNALGPGAEVSVTVEDPEAPTTNYTFVVHNGDMVIDSGSLYNGLHGMLLVNGKVKFTENANINGLVLATGGVESPTVTTITKNEHAVEVLLTSNDVAKYFKGYAENPSGGYLSSEAVDVKFENWKKN